MALAVRSLAAIVLLLAGRAHSQDWSTNRPSHVQVEEGTFQITSDSAGALTHVELTERALPQGRLAAEVRFLSVQDDDRWVSLVARESPGQPEPYVQFVVRREATGESGLEIARRSGGRWHVIVRASAERAPDLGEWFRMQLDVHGRRARGYLDGELVLETWWHGGAEGFGIPGLQVSGGVAELRDIRAEELAEDELAPASAEPVWIAHRGLSSEAPENTLASLEAAIAAGVPASEFDVRETADGELVLFHDETFERTTDWRAVNAALGEGEAIPEQLSAATFEQTRLLDAGAWKHPRFAGERVPTLRQALETSRGRILPVVEIKDAHIGAKVARLIEELDLVDDALVISFSERALRDVNEAVPAIPTALLDGDVPPVVTSEHTRALIRRARSVGANALDVSYRWITPELVRDVRQRGLGLFVYTVNDEDLAQWLIQVGVTGITSDRPGR